jgi:hypothetical protein
MKIRQLFEVQETMPSVKTPSPSELAKKHNVTLEAIKTQLKKGVTVELEHTKDRAKAREIALDHLSEFPDYYDRLKKVES